MQSQRGNADESAPLDCRRQTDRRLRLRVEAADDAWRVRLRVEAADLPGGSGCGLKAWAVPMLNPIPASATLPESSAPMTIFFMSVSLVRSLPVVPVGLQHLRRALEHSW
jgi:hypothetical protein